MNPQTTDSELDQKIREGFKRLPKTVQEAITSADVEKHLRELAENHKLHLDQWELLENEVMLTLLGFQPPEELAKNIQEDVEVPQEVASALAADISKTVFEPIRTELERELTRPAFAGAASAAPGASAAASPRPAVAPATPPPPPPAQKVQRAPVSETYKAGETSAERKSVHDDPYREPPQ